MSIKNFPTIPGQTRTITRGAFHEAGHAIVAISLGIKITEVELKQVERPGPDGSVIFRQGLMSWEEGPDPRAYNEDRAIIAMAGPESSEKLIGGRDELCARDDAGDINYVSVRIDRAFPGITAGEREALIVHLRERARSILDENWASVTAVAHSLANKRNLSGNEVRNLSASSTKIA